MKWWIFGSGSIFGMSNMRGRYVKTDKIGFSFYFSRNDGNSHWARVKVRFNPETISPNDFDGYMKLHGDYEWEQNSNSDRNIKMQQIQEARAFFKKYEVLFLAVWHGHLYELMLQDFFRGQLSFDALLKEFEVDEDLYNKIQLCPNLEKLEQLLVYNQHGLKGSDSQ